MAVPPCPDDCPEGVPYLDWISYSQLYQEYLLYCALATAAAESPGTGPFMYRGVYTNVDDADYVAPADASIVFWDVPAQTDDRTITLTGPNGQYVAVIGINTNGFLVNIDGGVGSINDTSFRTILLGMQEGSPYQLTGTAAQYDVGTGANAIPLNADVVHIAGTETIIGSKTFTAATGVGTPATQAFFEVNNPSTGGLTAFLGQPALPDGVLSFFGIGKVWGNTFAAYFGFKRNPVDALSYAAIGHYNADDILMISKGRVVSVDGTLQVGVTGSTPIAKLLTGTSTMALGTTGAIADTFIAANSPLLVTPNFLPLGTLYALRNPGVGFTILSTNAADAGSVSWQRVTT